MIMINNFQPIRGVYYPKCRKFYENENAFIIIIYTNRYIHVRKQSVKRLGDKNYSVYLMTASVVNAA